MKRILVAIESEMDFSLLLYFLREALKDPNVKGVMCEILLTEKDVLPKEEQKKGS